MHQLVQSSWTLDRQIHASIKKKKMLLGCTFTGYQKNMHVH